MITSRSNSLNGAAHAPRRGAHAMAVVGGILNRGRRRPSMRLARLSSSILVRRACRACDAARRIAFPARPTGSARAVAITHGCDDGWPCATGKAQSPRAGAGCFRKLPEIGKFRSQQGRAWHRLAKKAHILGFFAKMRLASFAPPNLPQAC